DITQRPRQGRTSANHLRLAISLAAKEARRPERNGSCRTGPADAQLIFCQHDAPSSAGFSVGKPLVSIDWAMRRAAIKPGFYPNGSVPGTFRKTLVVGREFDPECLHHSVYYFANT